MSSEPPSPALDLLVVGGLTVDRFADGREEPGGSVMHIVRAAAPRGLRVGVVTTAGREDAAQRGVDELRRTASLFEMDSAGASATFRHRVSDGRRRLWLEAPGHPVALPSDARARIWTRAILYAPVAGELDAKTLRTWDAVWDRGAILQGWLRTVDERHEVRPRGLTELEPGLAEVLATFDLLVASREDLGADDEDLSRVLGSMRAMFGPIPTLVLTDGVAGAWVQTPQVTFATEPDHVLPPRQVAGVDAIGAGDILAAFLLAGSWSFRPDRGEMRDRMTRAMAAVVEVLERRPSAS